MMHLLKNLLKKKKILDYPLDFAVIDFSSIALESGIKDNQNKIITRYFYNKFGNLTIKKIKYSEEQVQSLKMIYNIPVYDKTKGEILFPVYAKVLPSEVEYIVR